MGLIVGVAVFAATLVIDPPLAGLSAGAWRTFGLAAMMASWWISECVPIPVTSFLPIILAPAVGVAPFKDVTASYGHPLIFLFLGGFVLSLAIERTGLHERIARIVVVAAGSAPRRQIGGLMAVTAGLSMWISNTATAVIMLPIALSMARRAAENAVYGRGLLLGVAYGASIGGMATLVGTPPNAMLAAYLESAYGFSIGFGRWMLLGVPFSLILLTAAWGLLTWRLRGAAAIGDAADEVRVQLQRMGPATTAERRVGIVFVLTALAWMGREALVSLAGIDISDTGIAMTAALCSWFPAARGTARGFWIGRRCNACRGAFCCSSAAAWPWRR